MNAVLKMSDQMILPGTTDCTSLPESQYGTTHSIRPDGDEARYGLEVAHASRSAQPEAGKGRKTSAICGLSSTNSSSHAGPESFLGNKSQELLCLDQPKEKRCKTCQNLVPLTLFARHTGVKLRAVCNPCRAKAAAEAYKTSDKAALAARSKGYQAARRITQRASYLVTAAKQRAKTKGIPFDLDAHRDELQEVMDQGVCQMTGIPFDMQGKQTWNSPSLDRVVPSLGYVMSNVRVVLFSLNVMMHDWGVETVLTVVNALKKQGE